MRPHKFFHQVVSLYPFAVPRLELVLTWKSTSIFIVWAIVAGTNGSVYFVTLSIPIFRILITMNLYLDSAVATMTARDSCTSFDIKRRFISIMHNTLREVGRLLFGNATLRKLTHRGFLFPVSA